MSSVETQDAAEAGGPADTQQWYYSNKPRNCPNKLFNYCSTKIDWDYPCDSELLNHTYVETQFKLKIKLKLQ